MCCRRCCARRTKPRRAATRELVVWGSGTPRREFLYVDDLADACVHLMQRGYDGPLLNIGTGEDLTHRRAGASW